MSTHQYFSNFTNLGAKKLKVSLINQVSSINNSRTSLEMVTLLYQHKYRDDNLTLLYQFALKDDNLVLLIKNYVLVVIVLVGGNLVLWKTTSEAIVIQMRIQTYQHNKIWLSDASISI